MLLIYSFTFINIESEHIDDISKQSRPYVCFQIRFYTLLSVNIYQIGMNLIENDGEFEGSSYCQTLKTPIATSMKVEVKV